MTIRRYPLNFKSSISFLADIERKLKATPKSSHNKPESQTFIFATFGDCLFPFQSSLEVYLSSLKDFSQVAIESNLSSELLVADKLLSAVRLRYSTPVYLSIQQRDPLTSIQKKELLEYFANSIFALGEHLLFGFQNLFYSATVGSHKSSLLVPVDHIYTGVLAAPELYNLDEDSITSALIEDCASLYFLAFLEVLGLCSEEELKTVMPQKETEKVGVATLLLCSLLLIYLDTLGAGMETLLFLRLRNLTEKNMYRSLEVMRSLVPEDYVPNFCVISHVSSVLLAKGSSVNLFARNNKHACLWQGLRGTEAQRSENSYLSLRESFSFIAQIWLLPATKLSRLSELPF